MIGVSTLGWTKSSSHIVWFHSMYPNYINECTKIVGEHNIHENVIAIWDELIKKVQP
jgi:hypothetical protein